MTRWLLVLAPLLLTTACVDSWFYAPGDRVVADSAAAAAHAEQVTFAAPSGPPLNGWWLPAVGEVRGTVVFCHGKGKNLANHVGGAQWLTNYGFQVLLFDYRGYGRSEGTPSRTGTIADAVAAIDLALARDPGRVVVYGHSLGGAIAICAAAQRPAVRAIVTEGTFPSYRAAGRAQVPVLGVLLQFLLSSGDDPEDVLDQIPPRPLLIVHGSEDGTVPLAVGEALFDAALPPKSFYLAVGSGHRSPRVREGEAYERRLVDFFASAIGTKAR